jgi:hypothetical protein
MATLTRSRSVGKVLTPIMYGIVNPDDPTLLDALYLSQEEANAFANYAKLLRPEEPRPVVYAVVNGRLIKAS